ncbi:MAG: nicotinate-nucleotide diphosphorylase (carboxylating), partial [Cellvibrionales bacterium]|nr:nicotinate-nucleotide diphosphorylase (carboxylating) [Cellvibrionales bacterium]
MQPSDTLKATIPSQISSSLKEDIGSGDITAQLIDSSQMAHARIITRDDAIIAGAEWVNEVFSQIDSRVEIDWKVADGQNVSANDTLFELKGSARSLLTGERTALNFLQTLSAVATKTHHYQQLINHTSAKILDTRKTLPGLRLAQKYAVTCGGGQNHRIGLYDAFLIKEN